MKLNRILISRTDSIGDVMLTLPICTWLKNTNPSCEIVFLGKGYTKSVVTCFDSVDRFVDWNDLVDLTEAEQVMCIKNLEIDVFVHIFPNKVIAKLAKKSKIPVRIGTSHRGFHLLTCTDRPNFTRKNSTLHESQLNFELLRPLGLIEVPSLDEIVSYTNHFKVPELALPAQLSAFLQNGNKTVVLHPKSQGSAVEWPIDKYTDLAMEVVKKGYNVLYTGTEGEGEKFRASIPQSDKIMDSSGQLTLDQLIHLISTCEALVACSTGPLHIAGYVGIKTIGLFSPKRPIHPGRWKALGKDVRILVNDVACENCRKKKKCNCIENISVDRVLKELN
jgi:heptosyltransferase-3